MIDKRLLRLLAGTRKYIYQTVFFQWAAMLANATVIICFAFLLGDFRQRHFNIGEIAILAGIIFIMILVRAIVQKSAAKSAYKASGDVKRTLRQKIYQKLLALGNSYQEHVVTSQILQVAMEGVEQLEIYFGKYIPQLFYSLLAPLTLFLVIAVINLKTAVLLFICVPLIPASIMMVQKIAKKLLAKYWGSYTGLGDSFLENLQGLTTLKIYQADERKTIAMDGQAEEFRKATMRVLIMQLNSISIMDIVAYGGAAAGIGVALFEYQQQAISFTGMMIIILLASEFFIPMRLLGSFFHIAMNGMAASDKIFQLLELQELKRGECELKEGGDLRLQKTGFSYDSSREILKSIDLVIPESNFVAIVGASGCGKSTIAGLLTGKNKEYCGSISIGGEELSGIREADILAHITLVNHNGYLFSGTVEENLRMGKAAASEEEMNEVLKKVRLFDFLTGMSGLKTELKEQGSNLSGGQRQRLVLARALLRDTPVYIFDEATSNIDVESEEEIVKVIYGMKRNKTVIMISHRLEIVKPADWIYYLADGKVEGQGNHDQLMAAGGGYYQMYSRQKELEDIRGVS